MNEKQAILDHNTLRKRIKTMPENSVLLRSDFPEYQSVFVGGTLAALVNEGTLVKLSQGIYTKPGKKADWEWCHHLLRKLCKLHRTTTSSRRYLPQSIVCQ